MEKAKSPVKATKAPPAVGMVINPYAFPGISNEDDPYRNTVIAFVCEKFDITVDDVLRYDRRPHLVFPRHLIVYLLHLKEYGPSRIGRIVQRDHSVVYHAVDAIKNYLDTGHEKVAQINEVMLHFSVN